MHYNGYRDLRSLKRMQAFNALSCSLHDRVYHRQPAKRLAAQIAVELIGHDHHSPEKLQHVLDCLNELRDRLMSAKI